jgi:tetratricopeptide (TPR) repeat protein
LIKQAGLASILFLVPLMIFAQAAHGSAPALVERGEQELRRAAPVHDRDGLIRSLDLFRQSTQLNPQFARAYLGKAEAQLWLDDPRAAQQSIAFARQFRAPETPVDLLEAQILVLTGDSAGAQTVYRRVLNREPYNRDAQVGFAILRAVEGNLADRFMRELDSLVRRFPEDPRLLAALVEFNLLRDNETTARRHLAAALTYHGDIPFIQMTAARWAIGSGDYARGEMHAANAVRLAPTLEEGWLTLAQTALLQNKLEEARGHYEQLILLDRRNHRAWYSRGYVALRLGDTSGALESWDEALRIRGDYELARLARERYVLTLPVESSMRAEAALRYTRAGQQLEDQLLDIQAERTYRQGLQLNPFDTVLRKRLADLYLRQQLVARFVQELQIIEDLGGGNREIEELLESYVPTLRNTPAYRWDRDQFTAPRERTTVLIQHSQTIETLEPGVSAIIAEVLQGTLNSSQNIEARVIEEASSDRGELIARGRRESADFTIHLVVDLRETGVAITVEMIDPQTGNIRAAETQRRSGLESIIRAIRDSANGIEVHVIPRGVALERRLNNVLVSLGTVDGLEEGMEVEFLDRISRSVIGSGTVRELDDLIAEVAYNVSRPDRLTEGSLVVPARPTDETATAMVAPRRTVVRGPLAHTSLPTVLIQLFQLR